MQPGSLPTNIGEGSFKHNYNELGFEIINSDTSLCIYQYHDKGKPSGKEQYLKVPRGEQDALQFMVNKELFSGVYQNLSEQGEKREVTFSDDGKICGLDNAYSSYYINTDFIADQDNDIDEMIMDLYGKNQHSFAFVIKADTLFLYNVNETDVGPSTLGSLKYKLTRIKTK